MCVTGDALGVAKDEMAAKPLVLYEGDDMVALASEEIAIRAVIDHEIATYDPYESKVMVWQRYRARRRATSLASPRAGWSSSTSASRTPPRSTATRRRSTRTSSRPGRSTSSCAG